MELKLLIETIEALQKGQHEINRAALVASNATEEQLAEFDKMTKAMSAMQEHTHNLLRLVDALRQKEDASRPRTM